MQIILKDENTKNGIIFLKYGSLKRIKNIFYFILKENKLDKFKLFRLTEKRKNGFNMICFAFITYLEFLLIHTDNTFLDKKIASSELKTWYLNHTCRFNNVTRNMGKKLLKSYLQNQYIENITKIEIIRFLNDSYNLKS